MNSERRKMIQALLDQHLDLQRYIIHSLMPSFLLSPTRKGLENLNKRIGHKHYIEPLEIMTVWFLFYEVTSYSDCSKERQYYYKHRELAKRNKRDCLSLIIDGMDQSKTNLPHFTRERKSASSLWRLRLVNRFNLYN